MIEIFSILASIECLTRTLSYFFSFFSLIKQSVSYTFLDMLVNFRNNQIFFEDIFGFSIDRNFGFNYQLLLKHFSIGL